MLAPGPATGARPRPRHWTSITHRRAARAAREALGNAHNPGGRRALGSSKGSQLVDQFTLQSQVSLVTDSSNVQPSTASALPQSRDVTMTAPCSATRKAALASMLSDAASAFIAGTGARSEPDHWRKITDDIGIHAHAHPAYASTLLAFSRTFDLGHARGARASLRSANPPVRREHCFALLALWGRREGRDGDEQDAQAHQMTDKLERDVRIACRARSGMYSSRCCSRCNCRSGISRCSCTDTRTDTPWRQYPHHSPATRTRRPCAHPPHRPKHTPRARCASLRDARVLARVLPAALLRAQGVLLGALDAVLFQPGRPRARALRRATAWRMRPCRGTYPN